MSERMIFFLIPNVRIVALQFFFPLYSREVLRFARRSGVLFLAVLGWLLLSPSSNIKYIKYFSLS